MALPSSPAFAPDQHRKRPDHSLNSARVVLGGPGEGLDWAKGQYSRGVPTRRWSLLGRIDQKQTPPQDAAFRLDA